ncbi:MAG: cation diffusion facilitator family transporter [Bacteroidota bacterium]
MLVNNDLELENHHVRHTRKKKNLLLTIFINIGITLAQIVGGFISGSLALLSDALHNLTDVTSLIISYVAAVFSNKKASKNKTFGYKRAEIIAAFVNAATLLIIAVYLIYEGFFRMFEPQEIQADLVIWLSAIAIVGNGFSVILLHKDKQGNMNIQSAYLHLFTDMLSSVAVLIGGILMKYYQIYWIDGALTLLIAAYLLVAGYKLAIKSFNVLMLFSPADLNVEALVDEINALPKIKQIHHIHTWQLNDDEIHLEAHIDFEEDILLSEFDCILENIEAIIKEKYQINHTTIQPEFEKPDNKNLIVQD